MMWKEMNVAYFKQFFQQFSWGSEDNSQKTPNTILHSLFNVLSWNSHSVAYPPSCLKIEPGTARKESKNDTTHSDVRPTQEQLDLTSNRIIVCWIQSEQAIALCTCIY
jgi:hypothetical protein